VPRSNNTDVARELQSDPRADLPGSRAALLTKSIVGVGVELPTSVRVGLGAPHRTFPTFPTLRTPGSRTPRYATTTRQYHNSITAQLHGQSHDFQAAHHSRQRLKRLEYLPLPASGILMNADCPVARRPAAPVYVKDKAATARNQTCTRRAGPDVAPARIGCLVRLDTA
jgi:hypothetical protein